MPKALTIEEKRARNNGEEKQEAVVAEPQTEGSTKESEPSKPVRRRNVFNGTEGKLQVRGTIPGYHLHILNDVTGRIETAH